MKHGDAETRSLSDKPRRPDIHVAPPLVYASGFAIGFVMDRFGIPVRLSAGADGVRMLIAAGLALTAAGILMALWGVAVFRRAKTTILPFRAATAVVSSGPYRFTRNPMYLGMTLGYLGASLAFNTAWPMILLPLVLWAMVQLVITREEAFLSTTFGQEYDAYRRRVRRWL